MEQQFEKHGRTQWNDRACSRNLHDHQEVPKLLVCLSAKLQKITEDDDGSHGACETSLQPTKSESETSVDSDIIITSNEDTDDEMGISD